MQALKCLSSTQESNQSIIMSETMGVFDVSHMGEITIIGPESELFLENCATNDIRKLEIGNVQYFALQNNR